LKEPCLPELPEVETVRRGLEPVMVGATITRVEQRRADLRFAFPLSFVERLEGARILSVERRAKYLLVGLSTPEILVIHLGMSGRLSVQTGAGDAALPLGDYVYDTGASALHDHVVLTLSTGMTITYNDPRRFGFMLLIPSSELAEHPLFANLGVEPLGNVFDAAYLAAKAHGRRTDLKAFLLDQRVVAGLGNIYVSEALHRAGLSPHRGADSLSTSTGKPHERARRLVPEIRAVLNAAIDAGGSSLRDYRQADGQEGSFQKAFSVYGRDGQACMRPGCAGFIERTVQAQRATFACRRCQR
jgi:formamidopyrimidine-DNA glycosylase